VTTYTLEEIAARLGGVVKGDAGRTITGIKPLDQAGPDDLSFVANPRYRGAALESRAACLLASPTDDLPGRNLIQVANPYAAFASAMQLFFPPICFEPGVNEHAIIGKGTALGEGVSIAPLVVVGRDCVIEEAAALLPGVVIGDRVRVGPGAVLHPGVVIYEGVVLGARVIVHAGCVIGSDGFGYAESGDRREKIPQVGNVVVGDDVEIGACTTIDRATFGSTEIGAGTKIDNLVQIAHNVTIGEGSVLVAQSGIAGSTRLGRRVVVAGQSGAAGHLTIGDGAVIGAKSAVLRDLAGGSYVLGHPAIDHREWKRTQVAAARLPQLLRRVARLEDALSGGGGAKTAAHERPGRGTARGRRARTK
jgi:UDP-3-O-[3-hydroxymyristoyl] glucosamine N-acyltransferase